MALDELAAEWLRDEHRTYGSVTGPFMPGFVGWHDDEQTFLVLEDLSDAAWPPPWSHDRIDAVLTALDAVHATQPPNGTPTLESIRAQLEGWKPIAADPGPFLSTGLCSAAWFDDALPVLMRASEECELAGDCFIHLDVRSDNVCFRGARTILVDWNHAHVGNPLIDLVAWLPSLSLECGQQPSELLPDSKGLAAFMAGFFASRAGLPPPATAPKVRDFQRRQAAVALPWAAQELGLPSLPT
jgi:phosphotransferase family enzyme